MQPHKSIFLNPHFSLEFVKQLLLREQFTGRWESCQRSSGSPLAFVTGDDEVNSRLGKKTEGTNSSVYF